MTDQRRAARLGAERCREKQDGAVGRERDGGLGVALMGTCDNPAYGGKRRRRPPRHRVVFDVCCACPSARVLFDAENVTRQRLRRSQHRRTSVARGRGVAGEIGIERRALIDLSLVAGISEQGSLSRRHKPASQRRHGCAVDDRQRHQVHDKQRDAQPQANTSEPEKPLAHNRSASRQSNPPAEVSAAHVAASLTISRRRLLLR